MVRKNPVRGMALRVMLFERGITQKQAAKLMGMRYPTFNMKVLGERHFTPSERERLAELLGKSEGELFPTEIDNGNEENTQEQGPLKVGTGGR